MDRTREQAFRTILGGVADAFDLTKETAKVVARYDTAPLVRPENIDQKWNNHNNYVDNAKSLGKLLLLARRLCERGCGFVTVTTNFVWDMHADVNNAGVAEGMRYMGRRSTSRCRPSSRRRGARPERQDPARGRAARWAERRRSTANGGRDHWGNLAPLLLAGGGLKMGQVIGQSNKDGGEPQSDPVRIPNLIATILHTLFDVGELRLSAGPASRGGANDDGLGADSGIDVRKRASLNAALAASSQPPCRPASMPGQWRFPCASGRLV